MSARLQQVHVRVNEAPTGAATPVRVRFTDAEGNAYAPYGRLRDFPADGHLDVGGNVRIAGQPWSYIDGTCEIALPPGPIRVEVHKGFEFRPLDEVHVVRAGQLALRLQLERLVNLREQGWYSGDVRAFAPSPHAALLEAQGEDLAVVNLLAAERKGVIPHLTAFSGQQFALAAPTSAIAVNTYNRHPLLGSLALLHCHRVVYPLAFGGAGGLDHWTLEAWCEQCHRKNGLVVWTNTDHQTPEFRYGEPLANLVLGHVDAFELHLDDDGSSTLGDWWHLLDAGLSVPIVGSSGKLRSDQVLGSLRTYAQLAAGEAFSYRSWIEAVRAGRTFVSNGPLLFLDVQRDGDRIRAVAQAQSVGGFDRVEVLCNGEVVAEGASEAQVDLPLEPCWLAARCVGEHPRAFAHTSATQVRVPGRPDRVVPAAVRRLLLHLEHMQTWAQTQARCETPAQRQQVVDVFVRARHALESRLARL